MQTKWTNPHMKPLGRIEKVVPNYIKASTAPGRKFLTEEQAFEMVKPTNRPLLEVGKEITVRPGVILRRVLAGAAKRYQLIESK